MEADDLAAEILKCHDEELAKSMQASLRNMIRRKYDRRLECDGALPTTQRNIKGTTEFHPYLQFIRVVTLRRMSCVKAYQAYVSFREGHIFFFLDIDSASSAIR